MSSGSSSTPSSSRSSSMASSSAPSTPPNLHQNSIDPSSKWLVQKFGGTSVGKFPVKIAQDIVASYIDSNKVAIVCSARSGSTKALGTTNLLLRAASEALHRPQRNGPIGPSSSGYSTPFTNTGRFNSEQSQSPPPTPYSVRSSRSDSESYINAMSSTFMTPLSPSTPTEEPNMPEYGLTVDLIRREHHKAARESVQSPVILNELLAEIDRDCDWLRGFLSAAQIIDEISPRSKDSILGLGERLGCKIMTAVLQDQGIDAEYVTLESIVPPSEDVDQTENGSLGQSFYDRLSEAVGERVKQCGSRVPVITGFFGPVPGSLFKQVGRGYTDLLSALLAVGLEASELQVWKEVDGIYTADPRKVPTARLLSVISPEEAAELTYYGSEVVHPFTMEQAIRRSIPIRIKNVENPRGHGTVIHPDSPNTSQIQSSLLEEIASSEPINPYSLSHLPTDPQNRRLPTAVTIKENITILNVNSNRKNVSHGFLAGIFSALDRYGVVVDLISTSQVYVSMAIEGSFLFPSSASSGSKKVLQSRLVRELERYGTVSIRHNMAILSLVGTQMRSMVGIAGRMFTTLAQGSVNIEMISQGANEINISCVIDGKDAVKALNLIHQSCLQIKPEGPRGRVGPWLF